MPQILRLTAGCLHAKCKQRLARSSKCAFCARPTNGARECHHAIIIIVPPSHNAKQQVLNFLPNRARFATFLPPFPLLLTDYRPCVPCVGQWRMDDDELKMPSRAKKGSKSMRIRYSLCGLKRKSKTAKKILNQPKRPFFICVRTVGTGGSGNDVINLEQDSTHVSHSPLEHTSPCTSYNAIPNGFPNQKNTKNKQNTSSK